MKYQEKTGQFNTLALSSISDTFSIKCTYTFSLAQTQPTCKHILLWIFIYSVYYYRREDIDRLSVYTVRTPHRVSIHVLYATHANRLSRFWWIHNMWYCLECVRWLDNWVGYSHQAVRPFTVRVHIYLNVTDAWLNSESRLVDYIDTAFYW